MTLLDDERLLDLELGDLRRRLVLLSDELLRLLRRLDGGEGDLLLELLERVRRRRLLSSDVDLDLVRRLTNFELKLVRRTADVDLERLVRDITCDPRLGEEFDVLRPPHRPRHGAIDDHMGYIDVALDFCKLRDDQRARFISSGLHVALHMPVDA